LKHQPGGAALHQPLRELRKVGKIWAELYGHGNPNLPNHRGEDGEIGSLDFLRADAWIGRHRIKVQLEGVGAGLFDIPRERRPAAKGRAIQAANDRDAC
jgi:hypothetical protein